MNVLNANDCELELRCTDEILTESQTENQGSDDRSHPETKQTDETGSDQMPTPGADATNSPGASELQATVSLKDSLDGNKSHEDCDDPKMVRIEETENAQLNRTGEVIDDETKESSSSKSNRASIAAPEFAEREQHKNMAKKRKLSIGEAEHTEVEMPPAKKRTRRSELERLQEIAENKDFADVFSLARGSRRSLTKAKFGETNNNNKGRSKTTTKLKATRGRRSC